MSITSHILRILIDGEHTMDDSICVAQAMERGEDARRLFAFVDEMERLQANPKVISIALCAIATDINNRNSKRAQQTRPASNNNAAPPAYGPQARWGYDGPITPRLHERDWWPLRNYILERDGRVCRYCGDSPERMCADHVVPLSRGGSNEEDNLVACCLPCNSSKCDRLLDEWQGRYTA